MTPVVFANVLQPLIDVADAILKFLHDTLGFGWGLSIVGMTVIVRVAILPLTLKGIRSMNAMRALQPQMKEIQDKYKDDRQRMNQEMMRFYRENKVNPFGSCLPLLLQFPIFMALFYLLRSSNFRDEAGGSGWLFVSDLTRKETGGALVALIVLYVGSQLGASLVMAVTADKTQQRLFLLFPFLFVPIIARFPSGLVVYWITTNFWTFGQQVAVRKLAPPPQLAAAAVGGGAGGGGPGEAGKKPPPPPRKRKRKR
jgi:YidC/Oxa1 family membrane protein insertase